MPAAWKSLLPTSRADSLERAVLLLEAGVLAGNYTSWSLSVPADSGSADPTIQISAGPADEFRAGPRSHLRFDLGSLTKALFGGGLLHGELGGHFEAAMFEENLPARCLQSICPEIASCLEGLTLLDLASHQGGLPAWIWFGRGLTTHDNKTLASLADADRPGFAGLDLSEDRLKVFRTTLLKTMANKLKTRPPRGSFSTLYSDCGYYLLAKILESGLLPTESPWTDWPAAIDRWNSKLGTAFSHASLHPNSEKQAVPFYPYAVLETSFADGHGRESSPSRSFGPCFDTNANILACLNHRRPELSLHAGLFGTAHDVFKGMQAVVTALPEGDIGKWRRGRFAFCLDTPTGEGTLSAARTESWPEVFGHLSYSGGSAWLRRNPQDHWVLLTNRTASRSLRRLEQSERLFLANTGNEFRFACSALPLEDGDSPELCSGDDWEEIRERACESTTLAWDSSVCRSFPDIRDIRQRVGALLWSS